MVTILRHTHASYVSVFRVMIASITIMNQFNHDNPENYLHLIKLILIFQEVIICCYQAVLTKY